MWKTQVKNKYEQDKKYATNKLSEFTVQKHGLVFLGQKIVIFSAVMNGYKNQAVTKTEKNKIKARDTNSEYHGLIL